MTDLLQRICDAKRTHVEALKRQTPLAQIEATFAHAPPVRDFAGALRAKSAGGYGLIAEIKKASPSAGLIRPDFDPAALARAYAAGGAACLSVLTDEPSFQGRNEYLQQARAACDLPVLRKDFMIDPWQVAEARSIGADCILIIMAAVDDEMAAELSVAARGYGMASLVEVHDRTELDRALKLNSEMIGINNRNLKDLSINLHVTEELVTHIPPDKLAISESGLATPADLARLAKAGLRCFLIGESLMRQKDVEAATKTLLAL